MANRIDKVEMKDILRTSFMVYAKSTIIDRSFPFIDGYKPVQRRILFDMNLLGLTKGKAKSARIVGDTMGKFHPHGDGSIYGAMCTMADNADSRNAAEIEAHGAFGKAWSNGATLPAAAYRYTEAKLSKLISEWGFNGLNENAVDMIDNFDNTEKEPLLLPIAYPNIIINSSSGVACGIRTYIPSYTLKNACEATIGLLKGTVTDEQQLVDILDAPDFQTGGVVNMTNAQKLELVRNGATKGIYITSRYKYDAKKNAIIIYEIPVNTTVEKLTKQIEECIKDRKIQGITRVVNSTGQQGLSIDISLQNNTDPAEIFKFLCAYTDAQKRISFQTKFVNIEEDGRMMYKEVGILSLLNDYWIPWRMSVIRRITQKKLDKLNADKHRFEAFVNVGDRMPEYVKIVMDNKRAEAKEIHFATFNLDDAQEEYLLGCSIDSLTLDGVLRAKDKLKALEDETSSLANFISSDVEVKKQIIDELTAIIKKYATPRKSSSESETTLVQLTKEDVAAISNEQVWVGITKKGKVKKAVTKVDSKKFASKVEEGDEIVNVFESNNNKKALVFTSAGFIYKMALSQLDSSSRTTFKESAWRFIKKDKDDMHKELVRKSDIFYAMPSGESSNGFNIIYKNGKIKCLREDVYNSSRTCFKFAFPEVNTDKDFIVNYDGVVAVTTEDRAIIRDLSELRDAEHCSKGRTLTKFPKMHEDEEIYAVYPLEDLKLVATDDEIEHYSNRWVKKDRGAYKLSVLLDAVKEKKQEYLNKLQKTVEAQEAAAEAEISASQVRVDAVKSEVTEYSESDFYDMNEDDI